MRRFRIVLPEHAPQQHDCYQQSPCGYSSTRIVIRLCMEGKTIPATLPSMSIKTINATIPRMRRADVSTAANTPLNERVKLGFEIMPVRSIIGRISINLKKTIDLN